MHGLLILLTYPFSRVISVGNFELRVRFISIIRCLNKLIPEFIALFFIFVDFLSGE